MKKCHQAATKKQNEITSEIRIEKYDEGLELARKKEGGEEGGGMRTGAVDVRERGGGRFSSRRGEGGWP